MRTLLVFIFFLLVSICYSNQQKMDSLNQALSSATEKEKVRIYIQLSELALNNDNKLSIAYAEKALSIATGTGDLKLIAMSNAQVGGTVNGIGDYPRALKHLIEAYKLFEETGDGKSAAETANSIGNMYLGQGDLNKAEEYYNIVLKYGKEKNDLMKIAIANVGLGNIYTKRGQHEQAIICNEFSASAFKKLKKEFHYAVTIMNNGGIYNSIGKYKEALTCFKKGLNAVEKTGNKYAISMGYAGIGTTYRLMKQYDTALVNFKIALDIALENNAFDNAKDIYMEMAQSYKGLPNADSAYAYLEKYIQLKDTLFKQENLKQIHDMQTKYEAAKTQKENEYLKASKAQQSVIIYSVSGLAVLLIVLSLLVYRNNIRRRNTNREITIQKQIIEHKNKEILDSIYYARRIQRSLLASDHYLNKHLPEHFILYKPKDIVSGDFYWGLSVEDGNKKNFMVATCDCTGHGVPGAFMSLLGVSFLNEITLEKKITRPDAVFNELRESIVTALNPEGNEEDSKDGMDATLCAFDFENNKIDFACANNPLVIVRDNKVMEFKADKFPIGKHHVNNDFNLYSTDIKKGDMVYMFTDGYADQFGGEQGKKFKYKQMLEVLKSISMQPVKEQYNVLNATLEKWKGDIEQLDDILVIGIRV